MGMVAKLESFEDVGGASFCGLTFMQYNGKYIIGKQLMS